MLFVHEARGEQDTMILKQSRTRKFVAIPFFVLLAGLLAACGSASATSSASSTSTTPTTTTACPAVTTGTIESVNGTTLQISSLQGQSVQATLTSKTTISQQQTLKPTDIQTGSPVSVMVKQNADNTYSALTVTIRNPQVAGGGFGGFGGFRRGGGTTGACSARRGPRGNGTPGAFGGNGGPGAGQARQTISGTVSQIKATSLTLTDANSNDYTVALTSTTRISTQQVITASSLHNGEAVAITGSASGTGSITATNVSVLAALPVRRVKPVATPTATSGA